MNRFLAVLSGTGITFLATVFGSALVFFFRKEPKIQISQLFLGFASGIMIAASVWSLLIPSIDLAVNSGSNGWIPAACGFLLGGLFLWALDQVLPHEHSVGDGKEGLTTSLGHASMLFLAVTLHNIPEGMAVGLAFALASKRAEVSYAPAFALAIGVAIQNFPEGAAISLPVRQEGLSCKKAFFYGALSGAVEPIAGFLTMLFCDVIEPIMPWLLAFAAGAMIFVVAEDLIPQAHHSAIPPETENIRGEHLATMGVMIGFAVMMILDVIFQ